MRYLLKKGDTVVLQDGDGVGLFTNEAAPGSLQWRSASALVAAHTAPSGLYAGADNRAGAAALALAPVVVVDSPEGGAASVRQLVRSFNDNGGGGGGGGGGSWTKAVAVGSDSGGGIHISGSGGGDSGGGSGGDGGKGDRVQAVGGSDVGGGSDRSGVDGVGVDGHGGTDSSMGTRGGAEAHPRPLPSGDQPASKRLKQPPPQQLPQQPQLQQQQGGTQEGTQRGLQGGIQGVTQGGSQRGVQRGLQWGTQEVAHGGTHGPQASSQQQQQAGALCPVVLILVGAPGAGKSTLCAALPAATWAHVNQDTVSGKGKKGSRKQCIAAVHRALSAGRV